jgi:glycosyltransferase involved in cell wall biosynthesis
VSATVAVVLPVLDEREALPWVLGRMPDGYHPVVVDNGSADGSGALARQLGATVVDEPRRGFGSACHAGLAATSGADLVAFLDADGSLDPADLPALVALVEAGALDLALGARRPERGAWPVHARLANRWLARRLRHRYGWPLTDLGPMRVARRDPLAALGLADRRSGWPLEMLLRAGDAGWSVGERPVPYCARSGRSKVTGTVRGTVGAVRDMRRQLVAPGPPIRDSEPRTAG